MYNESLQNKTGTFRGREREGSGVRSGSGRSWDEGGPGKASRVVVETGGQIGAVAGIRSRTGRESKGRGIVILISLLCYEHVDNHCLSCYITQIFSKILLGRSQTYNDLSKVTFSTKFI